LQWNELAMASRTRLSQRKRKATATHALILKISKASPTGFAVKRKIMSIAAYYKPAEI
jgi:hypothetical protein